MPISDYYTSAGSNVALFPEGQSPASVNDGMRTIQADLRADLNDRPWINYGNGTGTPAYTYISGTSFSVSGDVETVYHQYRRVRAVGAVTGTIYGSIVSGTHSAGTTTVVAVWDSGSLSNETLTISLWHPATVGKEGRLDRDQTWAGANTFSGDATFGDVYVNGQLYIDGVPEDPPEFGSAAVKNIGTSGDAIPLLNTSCTWTSSTTQTFGTINVTTFKIGGTTYDLGTASTYDIGNSGAKVPLLNGTNTFSGTQTFNTINATTLQIGGTSRNAASTTVAGLVELATSTETVLGDDTARAMTPGGFSQASSIGNPGYYTLPGGLIKQFGFTTTGSGGLNTITFPIGFGSTVLSLQLTVLAFSSNYCSRVTVAARTTFTSQMFTLDGAAAPSGVTFYWEATGY
jgi:hypothetical protein